jgi:hypothetical protein
MMKYSVVFLEPAKEFLDGLESKSHKKVLFNIWKSKETLVVATHGFKK